MSELQIKGEGVGKSFTERIIKIVFSRFDLFNFP